MLDCQLFGLNPGAHHLVNVAFHATNAILLLLLLARMTGKLWRSAFVAALFALHPLHVESVAWIAERKDVLSALFWITTIFAYVRYAQKRSAGRYTAVILSFVCALLSKPMAVTLPFVLFLLDYWPLYRIKELRPHGTSSLALRPQSLRWLIMEKLPLLALSLVASAITFLAQKHDAMVGLDVLPFTLRMGNAIVSYGKYLYKTVLPIDLAVIYPLVPPIPGDQLFGAIVFLGAISVASFYCARSHPYFLVGWLWFLGSLIPVIGLVQVGEQAMADRYTYLPLIGVFLAVVWGFADFAKKRKLRLPTLVAISVIVIGSCLTATLHQLTYWRDDVALFSRATLVTSQGATAHALLADALVHGGEDEEGTRHLEEALRIQPRSAKIHYECALVQAKQKQYEAAAGHFVEAVHLKPDFADAYDELGIVLSKLGRLQEAIQVFTEAIEHAPGNAKAYNNRGIARSAKGDSADALRDYQMALQLNSNQLGALKNLAWLEATDQNATVRNGADAVKLAQRACELTRFQEPRALEILAASQAESGDFDMAIKTAQKAIDILAATQSAETETLRQRLLAARDLFLVHKPFRRYN